MPQPLADDLERWLNGEPLSVRPAGTSRLVLEWLRKNSSTAVRLVAIGVLSGLLMSIAVMLMIIPQVLASSAQSLDKFPSIPKPFLLWFNWQLLREIPSYVTMCFPVVALVTWVMQGPLIMLLLRPRDSKSALALGLGCGTISGTTAFLCGVAQSFLLATVVVPHIVDMRDISVASLSDGTNKSQLCSELLKKYPDLKAMPESERGGSFMAYLISMQVIGVFEGIFFATIFAICLGVTSVVSQALVAYYLEQRESSLLASYLYYLEFVSGILVFIAFPIIIYFESIFAGLSWFSLVLAGGLAVVAVIHQWSLPRRMSAYVCCILIAYFNWTEQKTELMLAAILYIVWMLYFGYLIFRTWFAEKRKPPMKEDASSPSSASDLTTSIVQ